MGAMDLKLFKTSVLTREVLKNIENASEIIGGQTLRE